MRNDGAGSRVDPRASTAQMPADPGKVPTRDNSQRRLSLNKPKRISLAEHVRHELIASMIDGRLPPGSRITEMQIAAEMGISRNPVREALAILIDQGMLQRNNLRLEVRAPSSKTFAEIFAVRRALEALAIEIIMSRPERTSLQALDEVLQRMDASIDSPETLLQLDLLFHETLCRLSGNAFLLSLFTDLSIRIQAAVQVDHSRYLDAKTIVVEHAELVHILQSGDTARAVEAIKRHIGMPEAHFRDEWDRQSAQKGGDDASGLPAAGG